MVSWKVNKRAGVLALFVSLGLTVFFSYYFIEFVW